MSQSISPRVLISTTGWWPSDAKLATSLRAAGCVIGVLCPTGHPVRSTPPVVLFNQRAFRRESALSNAIKGFGPDLIVPADERTRRDLHRLYVRGNATERRLIEASLGPLDTYEAVTSRLATMQAAKSAGLPVAETFATPDPDTLRDRIGSGPLVLKADGTSGGRGVRIVSDSSAIEAAWRGLTRPPNLIAALKRWLVNRDPFPMADWLRRSPAVVTAQRFVEGRPGDLALFCHRGEVLGAAMAVQEQSAVPHGPSTMVRLVDRPELVEGAGRLVRSLNLSGFIGLDFLIDRQTGLASVIELNPRATPLSAFARGSHHPVAAAARMLRGVIAETSEPPPTELANDLIGYFPAAWWVDPDDPRLAHCQHDIPTDDPALLAELQRLPWVERGRRARVVARLAEMLTGRARRHPAAGRLPAAAAAPKRAASSPLANAG